MNDHHEARFLRAVLLGKWDEAEAIAGRRLPDPIRLLDLARSCDVLPTLHGILEDGDRFDLVGDRIREALAAARHKCRMDNLLLLARASEALDRLLEAGIVPVALKGLDVLHRFHVGFDRRTLDDVDLLVLPEQVPAALEALEAAGWELPPEPKRTHWLRSSHHMPMESPGPVSVEFEIHWNLVQEERYRVDPHELVGRAEPLDVDGRRVLRLEDHDAAAHLLLHHLSHYFDRRLKWALDLQRIISLPGFQWERVAERLGRWNGRAAAALSLLHLDRALPGLLPREARRLFPVAAWRRLATLPIRSRHPLDLYRGTRKRAVQKFLAAVALERPQDLPGYLLHRSSRDRIEGRSPVERTRARGESGPGEPPV